MITDSGGVQEETSVLGTPCLTYRTTTERPITVELGTNELVGVDPGALREAAERSLAAELPENPPEIPLWDGEAGPRAAAAIEAFLACSALTPGRFRPFRISGRRRPAHARMPAP